MPAVACDVINVDDIEDLFENGDSVKRVRRRDVVVPKVRRRKVIKRDIDNIEATQPEELSKSIIPGTQRVFVKTWGCSHNNSDGEYMAGLLAAFGYHVTTDGDGCHDDIWLLNSCTVKSPAEDHFRNAVEKAKSLGKYVVVAGCVPQGSPKVKYLYGVSVVGVQMIDRVVEVVEETLKGHTVRLLGSKKVAGKKLGGAKLDLPKIRKNPLIEILPINTGCLNQCSYCKTKHARGELGSYPPDQLVARVKQAFEEGVIEVWLTSEDTGAYGKDIGVSLPFLLRQLTDAIPEGCMMRIGMTNPPYILEHLAGIAEILSHPRVYSFLHVPVQSGSDPVLADMKREYSVADFRLVVDFLKAHVPGVTIATDLICGYPTETEQDFQETMDLVCKYKFPSLFINQFFPRPGTPAARLQRVDPKEVKRRTRAVSELFQSYKPYDHKVGHKFDILVTEVSHDKLHFVGHNKFYEQVLIVQDEKYMGKKVQVEIVSAGKHYMKGNVIGCIQNVQVSKQDSGQLKQDHSYQWISIGIIALMIYAIFKPVALAVLNYTFPQ